MSLSVAMAMESLATDIPAEALPATGAAADDWREAARHVARMSGDELLILRDALPPGHPLTTAVAAGLRREAHAMAVAAQAREAASRARSDARDELRRWAADVPIRGRATIASPVKIVPRDGDAKRSPHTRPVFDRKTRTVYVGGVPQASAATGVSRAAIGQSVFHAARGGKLRRFTYDLPPVARSEAA